MKRTRAVVLRLAGLRGASRWGCDNPNAIGVQTYGNVVGVVVDARNVDAIVIACNTSCAVADIYGWPRTRATVFDLIDSATVAVRAASARRQGA